MHDIEKGDYMEIFPIGYGEFKIRKVEGWLKKPILYSIMGSRKHDGMITPNVHIYHLFHHV